MYIGLIVYRLRHCGVVLGRHVTKMQNKSHMLPPSRPSSHIMVLRPRGHDYDVRRVTYEATKRSFMMRCLYEQNTLCCGSVV